MNSNNIQPLDHSSTKPFKLNKFVVGGALMLIAVVLLIITSIKGNAQYYLTIEELVSGQAGRTENIRVSGVVLGESITYDPVNLLLRFTVAHIPGDNAEIEALGGLAQVLHDASQNPGNARLDVVYNGVKPDLLKNEAQAIITGSLGSDGVFYAEELLLKCPSRYEDSLPDQVEP